MQYNKQQELQEDKYEEVTSVSLSIYDNANCYCCRHPSSNFLRDRLSTTTRSVEKEVAVEESHQDDDEYTSFDHRSTSCWTLGGNQIENQSDSNFKNGRYDEGDDLHDLSLLSTTTSVSNKLAATNHHHHQLIHIVDEWDGTYCNKYSFHRTTTTGNPASTTNDHTKNQLLLHPTIPCLIRSCSILQQQCFSRVLEHWTIKQQQKEQNIQVVGSIDNVELSTTYQVSHHDKNVTDNTAARICGINRDWFSRYCNDTMVPVYDQPSLPLHMIHHLAKVHENNDDNDDVIEYRTDNTPATTTSLDKDGRALLIECGTIPRYMTMNQYMTSCLLRKKQNSVQHTAAVPYCKDWHFQFWYEQQQKQMIQRQQRDVNNGIGNRETSSICCNNDGIEYSLPELLPYDLLNGFLLRFDPTSPSFINYCSESSCCDNYCHDRCGNNSDYNKGNTKNPNDYRFVYWGPSHSYTNIHTDVLLSLSWSYNVYGCKLWTFYIPASSSSSPSSTSHREQQGAMDGSEKHENRNNIQQPCDDRSDEKAFSIKQRTGEFIIVPSNIKHTVVNLQETLSINHNWIIADILYNVWDCIKVESNAVDTELSSWQSAWSVECYNARETMLRNCVGLNVSLFFYMILIRGLDLLQELIRPSTSHERENRHQQQPYSNTIQSCCNHNHRHCNDLIHISNVLDIICNDPTIHLQERLMATLSDTNIQTTTTTITAVNDKNDKLLSFPSAATPSEEVISTARNFIHFVSTNLTVKSLFCR